MQWETVKNETVMRLIVRRPPKCLVKLMQERAKKTVFSVNLKGLGHGMDVMLKLIDRWI
jgi:hypothetical protein